MGLVVVANSIPNDSAPLASSHILVFASSSVIFCDIYNPVSKTRSMASDGAANRRLQGAILFSAIARQNL